MQKPKKKIIISSDEEEEIPYEESDEDGKLNRIYIRRQPLRPLYVYRRKTAHIIIISD